MFLRSLLTLFLLLAALPLQAEEAEEQRESEFRTQAEAQLCPVPEDSGESEDEESYEAPLCFVREVALEGEWAGARLGRQYSEDSLNLFHWQEGKWVQAVVQQYPNWEEAHGQAPELPEAVFNKLAKQLFPEE